MQINQVITRIEPSGPNNVLIPLARALAETGHDVRVISLKPDEDDKATVQYLEDHAVAYRPLLTPSLLGQASGLQKLAHTQPQAIWHTHCLRSLFLANLARVPNLVVTSHSMPDEHWPLDKGRFVGRIIASGNYTLMHRADAVISISSPMKMNLAAHGIRSIRINNPIDMEKFPAMEKRPAAAQGRMRLLIASRLNPRKNVDMVIRALRQMPACARDHFELVIAGIGESQEELQRLAEGLPNVWFLGFVRDMPPLVVEADVIVSASRSEGLPISLLEAMAAGRPLLLSGIPAHIAMFEGDLPPFVRFFELDDAQLTHVLTELARQPFATMPDEIRSWCAARYDHRLIAEAYRTVYAQVLVGKKPIDTEG